ncbi:hypothetical protein E4U46_003995, partial [Claviceps purpurea]
MYKSSNLFVSGLHLRINTLIIISRRITIFPLHRRKNTLTSPGSPFNLRRRRSSNITFNWGRPPADFISVPNGTVPGRPGEFVGRPSQ